ncbi:MAG TPA: DUF4105 domain-containing protein [Anaeromyxobacteraceae bacterium]|nr:DUF4105 domain-containing protein [Anaeromyxobacteraceae bacterium]
MRLLSFVAAAVALLPCAALAAGDPDPAYLPELRAAAHARKLSEHVQWRRLGRWRDGLTGTKSEVDGEAFFLAPGGKRDPAAELDATLAAFFEPEPADAAAEHPQCRFPARFAFLARELGIDPARLPPRSCPRFEEFWSRLAARSVTLVFSSYYMDNPSSAFGHTFLRLDKVAPSGDQLAGVAVGPGAGSDPRSAASGDAIAASEARYELLDQGVDYAAKVDTGNTLLYVVKGLAGLFRGEFTARPYFYKVREYADYESRDLWEYDLALQPVEVAMLVAHLWELGHTWFDYYYLTENCSYHVLGALEAAAPRIHLLQRARMPVIPAETVKALYDNPGLVRAVRFRPSVRTQFELRAAGLSRAERHAVEWVAARPQTDLAFTDDATRARVLDAALDLYDMRRAKDVVRGDAGALAAREELLTRRSAIPVQSPPLRVPVPRDRAPHLGHGAARVAFGGGGSTREGGFATLEWRAALHDLVDPPAGFSPAYQVEFLRARLRWTERTNDLRLDDATFVEATSLHHFDRFDRRLSYRLRAGAETIRDGGCRSCLAAVAEGGAGPAQLLLGDRLTLMLTGDAVIHGSAALSGVNGSGARLGLGPTLAVRVLGARASLLARAGQRWMPAASPGSTFELGTSGRLHLGTVSAALDWRRTPLAHEVLFSLQVFR